MLEAMNRRAIIWFAGAAGVYLFAWRISQTHRQPLIAAAVAFDLTITVSVAFYFLLIRAGRASWFTLATVAMAGLRTSTILFPDFVPASRFLAAPLELLVVANIARRMRRLPEGDWVSRIQSAARSVIPNERLAALVAAEISIFYYALFSWTAKPKPGFSSEKSSGYEFFGTLLIVAVCFEGIPLHLILAHYNTKFAWAATALGIYSVVWAVAIIRANRLLATQVDRGVIELRFSLFWWIRVPIEEIAALREFSSTEPRGYLRATFLQTPKFVLETVIPVEAIGLYRNRTVTRVAFSVDDSQRFAAAIALASEA
jgi:hypothetical protein